MSENNNIINERETQKHLSKALNRTISMQETVLLLRHLRYILAANEITNLTSITSEEKGILLHVEDSLTALQEVDDAKAGKLVDLGSGGGFPGIPLAVVTRRETTLIEATQKKARALEKFVQESNMGERIKVKAKRIEEISKTEKDCFAVATARALAPLTAIMELAAPLLMRDGSLIAYKGNLTDCELQRARDTEDILGMELSSIRRLVLSDEITQRTLVVFRKTKEPTIDLPRRNGKAQQSPY